MKQLKFIFIVLMVAFVSTTITSCGSDDNEPILVQDCDAIVDGIGYNIVNLDELTVEVVRAMAPTNYYSGAIMIPPKININGRDFTVKAIGWLAFAETPITSISIPSSVTTIGQSAFRECQNLKTINLPNSVLEIQAGAFSASGLESLTLPATVSTIGLGTFQGCENLKNVTIEDSTEPLIVNTGIGYNTLGSPFDLSGVVNIYVGREVVESKYKIVCYLGAFGISKHSTYPPENKTLKTIAFGENVTSTIPVISNFYDFMEEVVSITCKSQTPPFIDDDYIPNQSFMNTKVFVPSSALETYKKSGQWGKFWNIEPIK